MRNVRALAGDLLTLSFYFSDRPEAHAFIQLPETLVGQGAQLVGTGEAQRGAGVRDRPFADVLELPTQTVRVGAITDLVRYRAASTLRVVRVYLEGTTGTLPGVAEVVAYGAISPRAAPVDHHPLVIYTEGRVLARAYRDPGKQAGQARKLGAQLVQRFRTLIETLHPAYAAIIESLPWALLACPTDLRHAPRTFAFRTFFVSSAAVGQSGLAQIERFYARAYAAPLDDGLYVSTRAAFNPAGKSLDVEEAQVLSDAVTDIIAGPL